VATAAEAAHAPRQRRDDHDRLDFFHNRYQCRSAAALYFVLNAVTLCDFLSHKHTAVRT